jgi:hypothetical protein
MFIRSRLIAVIAVLLLAFTASGLAVAQTGGPDPNSPVKERTPTPEATETRSAPPKVTPVATVRAVTPTSASSPQVGTPGAAATPLTGAEEIPLAAMTLDDTTIPSDFQLFVEYYQTPEEYLADSYLQGQVKLEQLTATGMIGMYTSIYIDRAGNRLRTYIIAYSTIDGVQEGFNILEDEQLLIPNGSFTDKPGLPGVGEEPSEITSGFFENGDGTQTNSYDVSFRIDRYEVGASMNSSDESQPDTALVDQTARDVADRVDAVLAGEPVSGVDYSLPDKLLKLEQPAELEGFETDTEAFAISNPDDAPAGYVAGYFAGRSYSQNVTTALPVVTLGLLTFESDNDVAVALDNPESIMPSYTDLQELQRFAVNGADDAIAFSYSSPSGAGQPDSVRVFAQVGDQMVVVDVQGMDTLRDATAAASDLTEAEISCAVDGDCSDPGAMSPQ